MFPMWLSCLQYALNAIVFQTLFQSLECATTCSHVYVSGKSINGTFSSPEFPRNYPNNIVCHYVFQGTSDERIRITFTEFHLENGTGHGGCNKDYVDYFTINMNNQKDLVRRLCGQEVPAAVVSEHQRVEIVFKSDYLETHKGFFGIFEFVDEKWQEFPPSSPTCGGYYITGVGGVITSPGYPGPYEAGIQCTWMIRVQRDRMIILNFIELDLGTSVTCSHTHVSWYEGFGSPFRDPLDERCGQLYFYGKETGFTISSHRAVVRFLSGADDTSTAVSLNRRFKLSWTAVQMPKISLSGHVIDPCHGFYCEGGEYCIDSSRVICHPLPRYCIAESLLCNGVPNCGAGDSSDEDGCILKIFLFILAAVIPLVGILGCAYATVRYKRKRNLENNNHKKNKKGSKGAVNLIKMDTSPILVKRASVTSYSSHHGRYHNVYSSPVHRKYLERNVAEESYDGAYSLPTRRKHEQHVYASSYEGHYRVVNSPQSPPCYATVRYASPQPSPEIRLAQDRRFVQSSHSISADV